MRSRSLTALDPFTGRHGAATERDETAFVRIRGSARRGGPGAPGLRRVVPGDPYAPIAEARGHDAHPELLERSEGSHRRLANRLHPEVRDMLERRSLRRLARQLHANVLGALELNDGRFVAPDAARLLEIDGLLGCGRSRAHLETLSRAYVHDIENVYDRAHRLLYAPAAGASYGALEGAVSDIGLLDGWTANAHGHHGLRLPRRTLMRAADAHSLLPKLAERLRLHPRAKAMRRRRDGFDAVSPEAQTLRDRLYALRDTVESVALSQNPYRALAGIVALQRLEALLADPTTFAPLRPEERAPLARILEQDLREWGRRVRGLRRKLSSPV